jgi:hypothetical protein
MPATKSVCKSEPFYPDLKREICFRSLVGIRTVFPLLVLANAKFMECRAISFRSVDSFLRILPGMLIYAPSKFPLLEGASVGDFG